MMKQTVLFITLILIVSTSCRKQGPGNPTIYGKWQLVRITGGLAGVNLTAAQWGHSQSYIFGEKSMCTHFFDNTVTNTTYKLSLEDSYTSAGKGDFVTIANGNKYEYSFAHDTLKLAQDIRVDGWTEWYVKVW